MFEEWKDLDFGYKISNFGVVKNSKGRECKPYFDGGRYTVVISKVVNGKRHRKNIHLGQEVFKHFGSAKCKCYVYYKDGNKQNNRIDNLYTQYDLERTTEQISTYTNETINCCKHYLKQKGILQQKRYDIDDIVGDTLLLCWKYLSNFAKYKGSYYCFVKHYVEIALIKEYKRLTHEIQFNL